jgi:hypothetical protein
MRGGGGQFNRLEEITREIRRSIITRGSIPIQGNTYSLRDFDDFQLNSCGELAVL